MRDIQRTKSLRLSFKRPVEKLNNEPEAPVSFPLCSPVDPAEQQHARCAVLMNLSFAELLGSKPSCSGAKGLFMVKLHPTTRRYPSHLCRAAYFIKL